ncbi:MAG: hypothetical protein JNK82_37630, partial [Myxococcaceae bacterium]|nr:hypothetical protein [Myxococcaceae bacterium]
CPAGSTWALTCSPGYTNNGADPPCTLGGWTGAPPSCDANSCVGQPPAVANGSYASCALVPSGSTCALTCSPGYTKNGADPTCTLGVWTGAPPSCDANSCVGQPPAVANGSYASCALVPSGSTCALTCSPGYTKNGADPTCTLGVWTGAPPSCDANSCVGQPSAVTNGMYASCVGASSGASCPLTCLPGYYQSGNDPLCTLGVWVGMPSCLVGCSSSAGCSGATPLCDVATHTCVAVDAGTGCGDGGVDCDGGTSDAGLVFDAGEIVDAGATSDAGTTEDAGVLADAGAYIDAGSYVDAGAPADAGTSTPTDGGMEGPEPVGCGCSMSSPLLPLAALAVLLAQKNRRRRGS